MSETNSSSFEETTQPKYRPMLVVVIILGILLAIGTGVLIAGLIFKSKTPSDEVPVAAQTVKSKQHKPASIGIAPGFRILGSETQPGRLILHIRSETQDQYAIIDIDDGRMVAIVHAEVAN